jgi:hypothetical protein
VTSLPLASATGDSLDGILRYDENEHSFSFTPASPVDLSEQVGADGLTSLSIGTLQVELGVATRIALFVWGLHPRASWQAAVLPSPNALPGVVRVGLPDSLRPGETISIAGVGRWSTLHDERSDWVRVAAEASNFR